MIDKRISVSDQVANLSVKAQLVFTWSIVHADDLGLLPDSIRTLKATIVPMWDIETLDFSKLIDEIVEQGLFVRYEGEGHKFLCIPNFPLHQTLKRDRNPSTKHPKIKTWKEAETYGFRPEGKVFRAEDNGNLYGREGKGTEENGREPNTSTASTPRDDEKPSAKEKVKQAKAEMQNATATDSKELADVMHGFKAVNPSIYLLYGNKTQRKALDRMIHEHGEEQVRAVIAILPEVNKKKYSGLSITTPVQLENNLGKLLAYVQKQGDSGKGKTIIH